MDKTADASQRQKEDFRHLPTHLKPSTDKTADAT